MNFPPYYCPNCKRLLIRSEVRHEEDVMGGYYCICKRCRREVGSSIKEIERVLRIVEMDEKEKDRAFYRELRQMRRKEFEDQIKKETNREHYSSALKNVYLMVPSDKDGMIPILDFRNADFFADPSYQEILGWLNEKYKESKEWMQK